MESTKATKHYGVLSWSIFDEVLDRGEKTVNRRDGTVRANTFTWYIAIDDDLRRDQVIKFSFYRSLDFDFTASDLIFTETLYESKDTTAPRHKSKSETIKINCSLKSDFTGVDRAQLQSRVDKNGDP